MDKKFTVFIESKGPDQKDTWTYPTEGAQYWLSSGDFGPRPHPIPFHFQSSGKILTDFDILLFETFEEAEKFAKNWRGYRHVIPNGKYEVVELEPIMVIKQEGWAIKND